MVYTGKPSTGCRTCRLRRIKCDENRPACIQCAKSKRECGGYPDLDDLIFQHQTSSTIKKARRAEAAKRKGSSSPSSSSDDVALIPNPTGSVETVAIDFYLNGTIVEPASGGKYLGHLEMLPKLYLQAPVESALSKVTKTLCLAAFSNFGVEGSSIMQQALEAYGNAVVALHHEMKDLQQRKKNELLMAVMSMQAVEALLSWNKAPTMQWASHMCGAAGLLKSRGNDVLGDQTAARIFMIIRHHVQEGSNARGMPLDPFFSQMISETVRLPNTPEVRLALITKSLKILRTKVLFALRNASDRADLAIRLNECQWMDEELVNWAADMPNNYTYEATDSPISSDDLEFNLQEHRYQDMYSHRLWNSYRTARIFANILAYRCMIALMEDGTEQYLWNAQAMADAICSSIPIEMRSPQRPPSAPFTPGQQAIGAFFLLWPLFVARGILSLPQSQRDWIRARMLGIAEKYQLRRTVHLVTAADEDETRPLWKDEWADDSIELVWEASFLYGTGAI